MSSRFNSAESTGLENLAKNSLQNETSQDFKKASRSICLRNLATRKNTKQLMAIELNPTEGSKIVRADFEASLPGN